MAIDFHSAGSDPGPIVTTADVASVLAEVRTFDIPVARIAVESAVYAYNWTVNSAGHRLAGTKAASLTPTEVISRDWPMAGSQDGETYYRYTADGKRHEVWFAGSGLQYQASQLRKLCPGCAINVWATGNTDPVGSALILAAVGARQAYHSMASFMACEQPSIRQADWLFRRHCGTVSAWCPVKLK